MRTLLQSLVTASSGSADMSHVYRSLWKNNQATLARMRASVYPKLYSL
jgi:hypothetical protein